MKKLTIFAGPVFSPGGGIRHCAAVARVAGDEGWDVEVTIISRTSEPLSAIVTSAAPAARVTEHRAGAIRGLLLVAAGVLRASRAREGEVVYAPFPQSALAAWFASCALRSRATVWAGVQGKLIPDEVREWKRRIYRPLLRRCLSSRRMRVAGLMPRQIESALAELDARPAVAPVSIGNVAYGVGDAPWVQDRTLGRARDVTQRGGNVRCLVLARLTPEKGVDVAIKALAHLGKDVTLRVCGSGPELPRLQALSHTLGVACQVEFAGWSDSSAALTESDVLLVPSWSEALPLVVLEALWARRPVIASAVGAIPEVAEIASGVITIPPGSPPALAAAIGMLAAGDVDANLPPAFRWLDFSRCVRVEMLACA